MVKKIRYRRGRLLKSIDADAPSLLQLATLVLWLACLAIGAMGLLGAPPGPPAPPSPPPPPPPEPIQAELIQSEPVKELVQPLTPPAHAAPTDAPPAPPALPAVALPSPAIAFALPVEGPVRITDAAHATGGGGGGGSGAAVQQLGGGGISGPMPPPDYPQEAQDLGETGTVRLLVRIDARGRVISVDADPPSRWPLLNRSAIENALRNYGPFTPGHPGVYFANINFRNP